MSERRPLVVLEGYSPAAVAAIATEFAGGSGGVVTGWDRPARGVICVGRVATAAHAAAAVLCAVAGAGVVADAVAERDVIDRLCDDLARLGELDHRIGEPDAPSLGPEERQLLALLLGGSTLGQAAQALHISRRTADRRLRAARDALGAQSTSGAVAAAARAGIKPVEPGHTAR